MLEEVAVQAMVVGGVLLTCFVGPLIAIFFMRRRKQRVRAQRLSPLVSDLLRGAGHSVRVELDDAVDDVFADLLLLFIVPLLVLAMFLAQGHWRGMASMIHVAPLYAAGAAMFIFYGVRKLLKTGVRLDNLKAGYDAEVAVGQELDQLARAGAIVYHDVPAENFNIDHVVIAPAGVFAIETKGYTKLRDLPGLAKATVIFDGKTLRFPLWTGSEPLEQSERQARWLAQWLSSAVGDVVHVQPVLALPGWFVERTGRGGVLVVSGKELPWLLKHRGPQWLSEQDVQRAAHQIDQRCRTVVPRYRADEEKAT